MLNVGVDRYQEEVWRLQARGVNLNEVQQWISCCFCFECSASSRRGRTTILPAGVALAISVSNAVNQEVRKASEHYGKGLKCR